MFVLSFVQVSSIETVGPCFGQGLQLQSRRGSKRSSTFLGGFWRQRSTSNKATRGLQVDAHNFGLESAYCVGARSQLERDSDAHVKSTYLLT